MNNDSTTKKSLFGYSPLVEESPAWLRDMARFLSIRPQFVVSGNIFDYVLLPSGNSFVPVNIKDALAALLEVCGFSFLLSYDPYDYFQLYNPTKENIDLIGRGLDLKLDARGCFEASTTKLIEVMRKLLTLSSPKGAILIEYPSLLSEDDQKKLFGASFKMSLSATQLPHPNGKSTYNPIIWLVDDPNKMPDWLVARNEKVRVQTVTKPEVGSREKTASVLVTEVQGYYEVSDHERKSLIDALARSSEGLTLSGLVATINLAKDQGYTFSNILDAVQLYKLGVTDNPWKQKKLFEIISNGALEIEKQVKGQHQAILKTVDILKRAVTGFNGAQSSADALSGKPRGVLFFAGPTGVGKTELAKALSKLLFGDEKAYIRFDMSEFAQEHTEARLVGSPPGYIGHFQGGELTKAIKERPFSVVLFDEIEKAHPRILDKFLQILEDGRLTDGQGITSYFSEAIIIFTSNLGIYKEKQGGERVENVNHNMEYKEIESRVKSEIENYFKYKLVRPEILNRLGDNIVVFNFISREIAIEIFEKQLGNIINRIQKLYGVNLIIEGDTRAKVVDICISDDTIVNGGRGIGNRLETVLVNPLSRAFFDIMKTGKTEYSEEGLRTLKVIDISFEDGSWCATLS